MQCIADNGLSVEKGVCFQRNTVDPDLTTEGEKTTSTEVDLEARVKFDTV